jgi:Uracil DNA glycosylase superfamily
MSESMPAWVPWPPPRERWAEGAGRSIPDLITSDLRILIVGINPSLASGATGYHFATPGNRLWPTMHQAGWTDRQLRPDETSELLSLGIGITNLVNRAMRTAKEVSLDELRVGAADLGRTVELHPASCRRDPQHLQVPCCLRRGTCPTRASGPTRRRRASLGPPESERPERPLRPSQARRALHRPPGNRRVTRATVAPERSTARLADGSCWPLADPDAVGNVIASVRVEEWAMPRKAKAEPGLRRPGIPTSDFWASAKEGFHQISIRRVMDADFSGLAASIYRVVLSQPAPYLRCHAPISGLDTITIAFRQRDIDPIVALHESKRGCAC